MAGSTAARIDGLEGCDDGCCKKARAASGATAYMTIRAGQFDPRRKRPGS